MPVVFSTLADPKATIRAINNAQPIEEVLGKTIKLVHLVTHLATIRKEDDTEEEAIRTILVDDKGAMFACVSVGVLSSLRLILGLIDQTPPFDPPLAVVVNQKNTKGGRRVYKVDLA